MRIRAIAVAALAMPALGASAWAGESNDRVSLSAFGTLGAARTTTDAGEYATSVLQPNGARRDWDFTVDSLFAAQADVKATKALSFTLQVVANKAADDTLEPHVEWAFARYAPAPQVQLRAGILAAPIYMLSDSRLVGFSSPWVRVPTALYSQVPVTNFAGSDVVYRPTFGDTAFTLQPYFGVAHPRVPNATLGSGIYVTTDLDPMAGINVAVEHGKWTARAGYLYTKFTYRSDTLTTLFAGLRGIEPLAPGSAALAARLEAIDKRITFAGVGLSYDGPGMFFQAEYGRRETQLFLADTSAWYATLGYRVGSLMPHVTVSRVKTDSATSQGVVPAAGQLAALAGGINNLLAGQNPAQKTLAVGARYQFARNADVKLQWDRVKVPDGAQANFLRVQPGIPASVNVYSMAVDFVF
jgi:hypothetical protein